MLTRSGKLVLLAILATIGLPLVHVLGDGDPEPAPVAEVQVCKKLTSRQVIREWAIESYLDLLTKGEVAAWNKKRQADGGKLLDLAGKTWDTQGRADLALALEGLDLRGVNFSNVVFMPGTSFRFCDLSDVSFRESCLEGVTFTSVATFDARSVADVRSSSLANADLRDVVWTWDVALERSARRAYGDVQPGGAPEQIQARKDRRRAELDRRIADLEANPMNQFAFVDVFGMRTDEDAPIRAIDDPIVASSSKILARLVHAATAGTLAETVKSLTDRRRQATVERWNPLSQEPVLAAAIAAVDSDLAGIETWRAVSLVGVNQDNSVVLAGGRRTLLVVDDERSVAQAKLLVSACPILAWRRGILPTTICSRPVILKDGSVPTGVLVGRPVFALGDGLRGDGRRVGADAGTFASTVVADVEGVDSCPLDEADRRVLRQTSLRDFALSVGEVDAALVSPSLRGGVAPSDALPVDVRRAIKAAVGKDAFADMLCYTLGTQPWVQPGAVTSIVCADAHAILIVDQSWSSGADVYAKGPIVVLEPDKATFRRCATKSWVCARGPLRQGQELVSLGVRVDAAVSDALEKDEARPAEPRPERSPSEKKSREKKTGGDDDE